jgi:hypothetical protein
MKCPSLFLVSSSPCVLPLENHVLQRVGRRKSEKSPSAPQSEKENPRGKHPFLWSRARNIVETLAFFRAVNFHKRRKSIKNQRCVKEQMEILMKQPSFPKVKILECEKAPRKQWMREKKRKTEEKVPEVRGGRVMMKSVEKA